MSKKSTILAIATISLGMVIMLFSLASCGFNIKELAAKDTQTAEHEIKDAFSNINVLEDTADIIFLPSDSEYVKVICEDEAKKLKHDVSVIGDTLEIKLVDERKWYNHLDIFSFNESKIKVYMPVKEYSNLKIESDTSDVIIPADFKYNSIDVSLSTGDTECYADATEYIKIKASTGDTDVKGVTTGALEISVSTGDVEIENITASSISVKTSTGEIVGSSLAVNGALSTIVSSGDTELSDVTCESYTTSGSTGKLELTRLVATGTISVERDTGDVTLESCDAANMIIETSTGDVRASLLSEKVFIVRTSTGKISVPETLSGGRCKITTSTGNITVTINN